MPVIAGLGPQNHSKFRDLENLVDDDGNMAQRLTKAQGKIKQYLDTEQTP